ncbi:MAG: hypothetical protein HKN62_12670 [Phycisphaerales bacterium]|nr:hypothetical protein [Phycisphaerales bacterium]
MSSLSSARVVALHRLRNRFDGVAAAEKTTCLQACAERQLTNPRVVRRYHETLLFMAAYPANRGQASRVDAELTRVTAATPALFRSRVGAKILKESGLAGEAVEGSFSIAMIEWLLTRFPGQIELAWLKGTAGADLDDLLSLALLPPERDGRLHTRFDMQSWLRFAVGADSTEERDLRWVLDRIRELVPDPELRDLIAECLDLRVRWRLTAAGPTRTGIRFPPRPAFMQRGPLKRTFDVARLLRRPLPEPVRLTPSAAGALIDVARGVLAVRGREADPVTYANPREVTLFRLERGIDIGLFGLEPRRRLPMESYFGYVAARNRVPLAYGGAWVLDRRAEIGVHLFDTFRGGESAFLFGQVLRTYVHHYRIGRLQVDPYQFGANNPEAIRSGAFWFYYRFGFRPRDAALREQAAEEWASIRRDRAHRTPAAVLRRFTRSPLVLDVDRGSEAITHPDPTRVGVALTETIRTRFGADRRAARRWAIRRVARLLPVDRRTRWTEAERFAFDRLCPVIAALPGLDGWPNADRRALVTVMRSKGGIRERDHVFGHQRHTRLRVALAELEASVDWDRVPARPRWRPDD